MNARRFRLNFHMRHDHPEEFRKRHLGRLTSLCKRVTMMAENRSLCPCGVAHLNVLRPGNNLWLGVDVLRCLSCSLLCQVDFAIH